jgi:NitT/TauT family transport system substrate-binding protein
MEVNMTKIRQIKTIGIKSFLITMFAASLAIASPEVNAADKIVVGHLGIVADGPYFIAQEKGFFKDEGIEVELKRFNSSTQALVPLATNQLQVVGGGSSTAIFNSFGRDWPVRIAISRTRDLPGFSSDTLIVRNGLRGQVKSVADLKGKTIAVNAPSAVLEYMVAAMLGKHGLTLKDVKMVYMPWPNMGAALQTGAIDAGAVVEPFVVLYQQKKIAFPLHRAAEILTNPPLEVSFILFNSDWSSANPDTASAFTRAYLRGARVYFDAMKGGASRAEVIKILTQNTRLKNPAMYDRIQWSYVDPNGDIAREGLQAQLDWYRTQGSLKVKKGIDQMIDERFVKGALEKLGRVDVK